VRRRPAGGRGTEGRKLAVSCQGRGAVRSGFNRVWLVEMTVMENTCVFPTTLDNSFGVTHITHKLYC